MIRVLCTFVAVALPWTAAAERLLVCDIDGRASFFSAPDAGPVPQECRPAGVAAAPDPAPDPVPGPVQEQILRRLDSQQAAIRRLETELSVLRGLPQARVPAPRPVDPAGLESRARVRDLGQDLERKLDALSPPPRP
jgi:hypothetical protein